MNKRFELTIDRKSTNDTYLISQSNSPIYVFYHRVDIKKKEDYLEEKWVNEYCDRFEGVKEFILQVRNFITRKIEWNYDYILRRLSEYMWDNEIYSLIHELECIHYSDFISDISEFVLNKEPISSKKRLWVCLQELKTNLFELSKSAEHKRNEKLAYKKALEEKINEIRLSVKCEYLIYFDDFISKSRDNLTESKLQEIDFNKIKLYKTSTKSDSNSSTIFRNYSYMIEGKESIFNIKLEFNNYMS